MSIQKEINIFKQTWGKGRQNKVAQLYGKNRFHEIVSYAKDWAYGDVKRTLNGIGNYHNLRDNALSKLEQAFMSYFSSQSKSKQDFDAWHDDLCQKLIAAFAQFQHKDGKIGIEYGCAQKLVNMTFKYIYCFDDIQNNISQYAQYFEHCHVTFDDKILEKCQVKDPRVMYLDKQDYLNNQKVIENYMRQEGCLNSSLTPFQGEFELWNKLHPKS